MHGSPSSGRGWERKGGLRQPSHQEAVSTMAWTPLLLMLLSLCTGRPRPRAPGLDPQPASAPGVQTLCTFPAAPAPSPRVCVFRLRLPACADSARLPLCVSGSISQTLLHPEQRLQCWQLYHILVSAEGREPTPVPPEVQVRLR